MDNEDNEDGNKEEVQQQNDAVNNDEISTPIQTLNTKDNQDKSNINTLYIYILYIVISMLEQTFSTLSQYTDTKENQFWIIINNTIKPPLGDILDQSN